MSFDFDGAEPRYSPAEASMEFLEKLDDEERGLDQFLILAWGRNVPNAYWARANCAFELVGALEAMKAEVLADCTEDR